MGAVFSDLLPRRPRLPGLAALRDWRQHLRGDVVAGTAVAAYLVPQCLAYAGLAGLEPVRGLWAALAALVVYALLGSSRLLSVGPESASALLVGAAVATLVDRGLEPDDAAAALALAVAGVSVVAWFARLGFLADLLSKPVLVGYLAGVAVTMVVSQLPNVTGIDTDEDGTVPRFLDVMRNLDDLEPAPLLVAAGVVLVLVVARRFPRVPGPLVAILLATVVTAVFDLEEHDVAVLGDVPQGLPPLGLPHIPGDMWGAVVIAALGIAVVAFSGNVLTGRAFVHERDERLDPDQEWLALAGANAAVGVSGGFPVSSSDSRTALAQTAGASTQLTSLVAAACLAAVLVVLAPGLERFPLAALGGLVIYAGASLLDVPEMRRVFAFRHSEALIMAAAAAGVILFDLLVGVGVAVALSVADLLRRVARAHDAIQGLVPGVAGMHDVDDYPEAETVPGLVVYRYDAPLFFANAEDVHLRVLRAVEEAEEPVEWVVLNMEANVEIDLTATDMLEELRSELADRGIVLAFARVKHDLEVYLDRVGLLEAIGRDHVFHTLPTAVEGFHRRHGDHDGDVT
jgi:high affinity sulfate transporter 1